MAAVLAKAGKPDCLAAGHAAWTARNRGMPVLTSDPALLRALAADIEIDELPSSGSHQRQRRRPLREQRLKATGSVPRQGRVGWH